MTCAANLLYNPHQVWCDFPQNVNCGDRVIPESEENENPDETPEICFRSATGIEPHENCNQFVLCPNFGQPVTMNCPGTLLYNSYTQQCDWPENVDCGDRVIPGDCTDEDNSSDDGNGSCNCNPEEAPEICAADGSDGTLVAHENCNQFYKCFNGQPVALSCPQMLLYNPYTEQCDWRKNVNCGGRVDP